MKTSNTSQIWRIADLFEDWQPRTSNMVSKELNLKNKSVSGRLSNLVGIEILQKYSIGICQITGKRATYYNAIIWIKKGLNNGK